ncbi:hypothetical protein EVAR_94847_1 [Eumeta japonica]|uniref:Uncharacterized protein n=1 Tax=Eumeta variegata TaxID=151549 RepID=A0A4C1VAR6_EUMVA|nr:hypothetical protein EVAR_94847_1 [Eumeta japonica]
MPPSPPGTSVPDEVEGITPSIPHVTAERPLLEHASAIAVASVDIRRVGAPTPRPGGRRASSPPAVGLRGVVRFVKGGTKPVPQRSPALMNDVQHRAATTPPSGMNKDNGNRVYVIRLPKLGLPPQKDCAVRFAMYDDSRHQRISSRLRGERRLTDEERSPLNYKLLGFNPVFRRVSELSQINPLSISRQEIRLSHRLRMLSRPWSRGLSAASRSHWSDVESPRIESFNPMCKR